MTDGLGSVSYAYNQLSRMTSETRTINGVGTYTLGYDYNLAGELKSVTNQWNAQVSYGYDKAGKLSNVGGFLKKVDFDSKGGGIVRQGSETFVAEIVRGGQTVRFIWVDPDHHRPFPEAAESVIRWLQEFKAQGATALTAPESSTMQICPRMSDRPVQPVGESGANAGFACAQVSGITEDGAESRNLRRASTELPVKEISTMRK